MTRIFIEGQELDVNEGFSNQITYAIDDITNIDSKATSFSKTIVLPGTSRNNRLFGNIFDFANSNFTDDANPNVEYNFNASKSANARIDVDGLTIIKGVLRLLEIIVDGQNIEYEVAIFGELGGFANEISNKYLTDLDFSEYDHVYNITNIANSWNIGDTIVISSLQYSGSFGTNCFYINLNIDPIASQILSGDTIVTSGGAYNNGTYTVTSVINYMAGTTNMLRVIVAETITTNITLPNITIQLPRSVSSGYYYPLIDYGNVSYNLPSATTTNVSLAKKDYQFKAFRPAFFVRDMINRIIINSGYTWESNFFNTNFFRRLIIPNNDKALFKNGVTSYIIANKNTTTTYSASSQTISTNLAWDTYTLNNVSINGPKTIFTYTGAETIQTKVSCRLVGEFKGVGNFNGSISVRAGGVTIGSISIVRNNVLTPFDTVITGTVSLVTNATVSVVVSFTGPTNQVWNGSFKITSASLNVDSDPPTAIEYQYGQTLEMNRLLPKNIKQKDFFTSIVKMFNLMITEDKYEAKKLVIEPWVDFYDLNSSTYLDWSQKIDRSQPIRIRPMSETNARIYNFKYKKDSDYYNELYSKRYNETYGDRVYDNNLEFSKETSNTEIIFASTPLVGYAGRDKVVSTIFKMNNNVEDRTESIIRILQVKTIEGVTSWKVLNGSTTLGTYTKYPYAGHFDDPDVPAADLNFGATKELFFSLEAGALSNNLFNVYYSSYMAEITDKDSRLLTARIKLNSKDIFNLDFGRFIYIDGVLYRLTKIIDYVEGDICTVELLRVIYTTY